MTPTLCQEMRCSPRRRTQLPPRPLEENLEGLLALARERAGTVRQEPCLREVERSQRLRMIARTANTCDMMLKRKHRQRAGNLSGKQGTKLQICFLATLGIGDRHAERSNPLGST